MKRLALILAIAAAIGMVGTPARADLTDIQINSMTGGFNFSTCAVTNASSWSCTDTAFKIRSIPPTWNPLFTDVCAAVNNYSEGGQTYTTCSIQNGGNQQASITAVTSGNRCGMLYGTTQYSWKITWSGTQAIYYRDATGAAWRLTSGTIQMVPGSYSNDGAVDTWSSTVTMRGTTTDYLGRVKNIDFTLAGPVTSTSNCQGGSVVRNFSFSWSGVATINP